MFFRRVVEHLRKLAWVAIAIDFVIVVLGVFIGLQVNDWGASQAAKRRGHEYVERLIRDVENDLTSRRQLVAYFDAVYVSAEHTNDLLGQAAPDPTQLIVNAYRATEYAYTPPTRSTWDEIVSSGDLDLLPRRAVEDGLSSYYSYDAARGVLDALSGSAYRRRVRSTISYQVQEAIRKGCGDVRSQAQVVIGFQEDCRLDISDIEIAQAARALQRDPGVLSDLRFQFSDVGSARANLRGSVVYLEHALAALRAAYTR